MDRLLKLSEKRVKDTKTTFYRYLFENIDWKLPLIIIKGARGSGKTTMLLQRMKAGKEKAVYLSLDDFYFEANRLLLLMEELYEKGYRNFYLDEIHQYESWAKDLKNIYDNFSDIKVVATGSSALKIEKGQADLSRRAVVYSLYGLSFREFLNFEYGENFKPVELTDLLKNHLKISAEIHDRVAVLKDFERYLNSGYYPFFKSDNLFYHQKIQQIIQLITEIDIPAVENINYATVRGMKGLFYIISQSVPFTPNILKLSSRIGVPRNSVLKSLDLLEKGGVINLLRSDTRGMSYLQKPEKIYLENPNLAYVFSGSKPNKGNLRETFFFNQLKVQHKTTSSKFSDFFVDDQLTFEIGGADKTDRQIKGIPLAYIAADGIEEGIKNKIPLWLFGMLY